MTTSTLIDDRGSIPQWDLADRMRKAMRESGLSVQDLADYFECSRNTVSAWINGRVTPSGQSVRLWALRTGVPYEWLRTGKEPDSDPDPTSGLGIICPKKLRAASKHAA